MEQHIGLAVNIDDRQETVIAVATAEDLQVLGELLREGSSTVTLRATDEDTEGHTFTSEVGVDVEGHALTLRLPSPADAAALRRRLAMGAVTATLVAAGAGAAIGLANTPATAGQAPPAQQAVQGPAAGTDDDERRVVHSVRPEPR